MIPLLWIFFAWVIGVALFALFAVFTISLVMRFGLTGFGTLVYSGGFVFVAAVIILGSGMYLLNVDWSQSVSLIPSSPPTGYLFP